jgi:hypothetical protein
MSIRGQDVIRKGVPRSEGCNDSQDVCPGPGLIRYKTCTFASGWDDTNVPGFIIAVRVSLFVMHHVSWAFRTSTMTIATENRLYEGGAKDIPRKSNLNAGLGVVGGGGIHGRLFASTRRGLTRFHQRSYPPGIFRRPTDQ